MEDQHIIDLYWTRHEDAIAQTANKYEAYCRYIAQNILQNEQDVTECLNDTWLRAWETIPPQRPEKLSAYLGKITRNLALDRYRNSHRQKRGNGQVPLALEELSHTIGTSDNTIRIADDMVLENCLNCFLSSLPKQSRIIFLRRYWYFCSVKEIAADLSVSESKVKMTLLRARKKLRTYLEKEGIAP